MKNPLWLKEVTNKVLLKERLIFLDYIEKARKITDKPLMLTGGFRSVKVMEDSLADGKLDVIGLGRPFCLYPNLAQDILEGKETCFEAPVPTIGIKMLDKMGGVELPWYELQIQRLGKGKHPKPNLAGIWALLITIRGMLLKSFLKN